LANLYFRRFLLAWQLHGHQDRLDAYIVNYADDFVICCRTGNAEVALAKMEALMMRLGLEVNKAKTRVARLPEQSFDFLGYTVGGFHGKDGRIYIGTRPSKKAVRSLLKRIHERTTPQWYADTPQSTVARINTLLRGWCGYFNQGPIMATRDRIQRYAEVRLRRWLMRHSGYRGTGLHTIIAHIGAESTGLGLAVARCKHRHGCIVGVQLAAGKHVLADRVHQWTEQIAGCPNPAGQCGARDIHALTGVNLRLPIQGQVVSELGNDDVGKKTGPGKAALDRTRWRGRFNHSIATRASELRPHMSNHAEAVRNILQLFGNILTELPQLRAAIGTAIGFGGVGEVTTSRERCSASGLRSGRGFRRQEREGRPPARTTGV